MRLGAFNDAELQVERDSCLPVAHPDRSITEASHAQRATQAVILRDTERMLSVADAADTHLAGLNISGHLHCGLEMSPNQLFAQPQRGSPMPRN